MRNLLSSLTVVAALAGLAAGASACDAPASAYAAQVGNSTISTSELTDALSAVSGNPLSCEVQKAFGVTSYYGAGVNHETYSSSFTTVVLNQLVELSELRSEIARRHLTVTPLAREIGSDELAAALTPASPCTGTGAAVLAGFASGYRTELSNFFADEAVLEAADAHIPLTDQGVTAYEAAHGGAPTEACVSVIEVASKGAAQTLTSELATGTSFATLAHQHSIDTQSAAKGGALGCYTPSQLTQVFASSIASVLGKLATGTVSAPLQIQGSSGSSWLLLLVTQRKSVSFAAGAEQALATQQTAVSTELSAQLRKAHVVIDPAYGSWKASAGTFGVSAPPSPSVDLLANPSAVGATGSATVGATGATGAGSGATGSGATGAGSGATGGGSGG